MKKKIMALMLMIPILLTFALFSLAKIPALITKIHVTSINILKPLNDGVEFIELTEPIDHYLKYTIYPTTASNQNVQIDYGEKGLDVDKKTGKITAKKLGTYEIKVTTDDGGYSDELEVQVTSQKIVDYTLDDFVDLNGSSLPRIYTSTQFKIQVTTYPNMPTEIVNAGPKPKGRV